MSQANPFEHPDNGPSEIELPPVEPVEGGPRKGMMIVVPTLSEGQEGDAPMVATVIARLELTSAKAMTNRIHGKRNMLSDANPH